MKRDIHKFSAWVEKTVKEGLAQERAAKEWKRAASGGEAKQSPASIRASKAR